MPDKGPTRTVVPCHGENGNGIYHDPSTVEDMLVSRALCGGKDTRQLIGSLRPKET